MCRAATAVAQRHGGGLREVPASFRRFVPSLRISPPRWSFPTEDAPPRAAAAVPRRRPLLLSRGGEPNVQSPDSRFFGNNVAPFAAKHRRAPLTLLLMTKLTILLDAEALLTVVARAAELVTVKVPGSGRCRRWDIRLQNPEPLHMTLGAVRLLGIQVRTVTKRHYTWAGFSCRECNVRRHREVTVCRTGR